MRTTGERDSEKWLKKTKGLRRGNKRENKSMTRNGKCCSDMSFAYLPSAAPHKSQHFEKNSVSFGFYSTFLGKFTHLFLNINK